MERAARGREAVCQVNVQVAGVGVHTAASSWHLNSMLRFRATRDSGFCEELCHAD